MIFRSGPAVVEGSFSPFRQLAELASLHELHLTLKSEGVQCVKALSQLQRLRLLSLEGRDRDAVRIAGLTALTQLTELRVTGCAVSQYLVRLSGLRALKLSWPALGNAAFLSGLTSLRQLSLVAQAQPELLSLEPLSLLEDLHLEFEDDSAGGVGSLRVPTGLTRLCLCGNWLPQPVQLATVFNMPRLEHFTHTSNDDSIRYWWPSDSFLDRPHHLLTFQTDHLSYVAAATTREVTELKHVDRHWRGLPSWPHMRKLVLDHGTVVRLDSLHRMLSLRTLVLDNTRCGAPLPDLAPLTALEVLELRCYMPTVDDPSATVENAHCRVGWLKGLATAVSVKSLLLELRRSPVGFWQPVVPSLALLTNLRKLSAEDHELYSPAPRSLPSSLRQLSWEGGSIRDIELAGLPMLESLRLVNSDAGTALQNLGLLTLLQTLHFPSLVGDVSALAGLSQLAALTSLELAMLPLTSLQGLGCLLGLRKLSLSLLTKLSSAEDLEQLTALEELHIGTQSRHQLQLPAMSALRHLRRLDLEEAVWRNRADLNDLTALVHLRTIKLHRGTSPAMCMARAADLIDGFRSCGLAWQLHESDDAISLDYE